MPSNRRYSRGSITSHSFTNALCLVPPTQADWQAAVQQAQAFLTNNALTNSEKSSLATGVGWEGGM